MWRGVSKRLYVEEVLWIHHALVTRRGSEAPKKYTEVPAPIAVLEAAQSLEKRRAALLLLLCCLFSQLIYCLFLTGEFFLQLEETC